MKLASYRYRDSDSFGAVTERGIIDLKPWLPDIPDLKSLIRRGLEGVDSIVTKADTALPVTDVRLRPPVPNPGAIWCAALNTHSHFIEASEVLGMKELPRKPSLFLRTRSTLVGSGGTLEIPRTEELFDYEGEIALVIGSRGRNINVVDALQYIAGYSCFNDGSARQYQISSSQVTAGKNTFRSGGFGPWLATPGEVDLETMTMTCRLNGDVVQEMTLDDLVFSFAELIAFISELTWLEPGDVIVTGSPAGVGVLREPRRVLKATDRVEVTVSGVGTLENDVVEQHDIAGIQVAC